MSNRQPRISSRLPRLPRWRPSPQGFAAAAATGGDPAPLLALDLSESRTHDEAPGRLRQAAPTGDGRAAVVGRLLSVNVGGPRDVEWEGKTVRTAIWKEPVDGPAMVRQINIDGDDQADRAAHGGEHRAVFVYQLASYRYWARELDRRDFTYGQFGENFTVEGLADDEVCIGDRFRIGEATFELTQPRVTCFRVGIRMREPAMPSLLVAHRRPGFYLRVLQEGFVQAGDEIVRIKAGEERLSVAEIDGLLYLPNRSRPALERTLRVPALSDGWRGSFAALLEQADAPGPTRTAWTGFQPLHVTAIDRESETIVSLRLASADGAPFAAPHAGQYLTIRLRPHGADRPPVTRSYSLSAVAAEDGYRISVKREPGGVASGFLHEHVHPGDVVEAAAPRGGFTLRDGRRPVVLVSAGVGATPLVAMLHALARTRSAREVWWVHGARNRQEHAFADEVDRLLESLPHAHRIISYSRPGSDDAPGATFDAIGRIGIETIHPRIPVDADYYLCGPAAFMRTLSAGLAASGVPADQIATETFGAVAALAPGVVAGEGRAPHQPPGSPGAGPAVTFARSGLTVAWEPGYASLLELAEACDVPASFGCRTGVCHYCETEMLSGDVTYTPDPLEPPDDGRVLVCCSQPATEVTLDL